LDFLPRLSGFAKSLGFGQGNYKKLKAYFQHLLSSYNDLATGIGTKIQKGVRQRVCLQGAHSCSNGEDREVMKTVSYNVVSVIIEL
jgi:hypothetical protein